ncbi:unnamed protein product [[Candida] boidinii]|nr:unnamed protein product [[Candida] boidinii]
MESRGLKVLKLDEFENLSNSINKEVRSSSPSQSQSSESQQLSNKSIEEYEIIMNENGYKILSELEYNKLNSKLNIASKQVELLQDNLHLQSNSSLNDNNNTSKEKSPRKKSILLGGGGLGNNSVPKLSKDDYQNINTNLNSLKDSIKSMESNIKRQQISHNTSKKYAGSIVPVTTNTAATISTATGATSKAIGNVATGAISAAAGIVTTGAVSAISTMTTSPHNNNTKDLTPKQEIEELKQRATKHSLTVISKDEYENIVSKIDDQSVQLKDIKSKLELKEIEFKEINDTLIIKDQELKSIKEKFHTPTADYVKEKASNHGLVVIPNTDHQDLNNKIQSHEEQIKDLKSKYDMKRDENLSLNSIIEKKNTELSNIENKLSNPDIDFVKVKAQSHGMVIIPSEHHENLITNVSKNETKLKELESEISNVKENHKSTSDELLSKKIEIDNYNKKFSNPEVNFVKDIAGNLERNIR